MQTRPTPYQLAPEIPKHGTALQAAIDHTGVAKELLLLIQLRVSQINGCAFCLHMHTREARRHGETETRIYLLSAWRESLLFSDEERAVLDWAEALTLVSARGAPDALFDALKAHFSEQEIVGITSAISMINFWNRLAIGSAFVSPHERKEPR